MRFGDEMAWTQNWALGSLPPSGAECQTLNDDVSALLEKVVGAMYGVDRELNQPPAVFAAIREEVYARLVGELW